MRLVVFCLMWLRITGFTVRQSVRQQQRGLASAASNNIFSDSDFGSLLGPSSELVSRIPFDRPTRIQEAAFQKFQTGEDLILGAETGSGKTLAYLVPLMHDILQRKGTYDYARAMILVPNKELVQQVVRMATPLAGDDIKIAVMPGGLSEPMDFRPFRQSLGLGGSESPVDLVISTPASLGALGLKPQYIDMFADIDTLVVDEADMLLDGGYLRALENVLLGFRRADRLNHLGVKKTQHVFVAATLPDMGLRSVDAYLTKKFPYASRITMQGMHQARHQGLAETTLWIQEESKKARMERVLELLETPVDQGGLKDQKVMIFVNSVADVEGVHEAFSKAGQKTVPYHAKLGLEERTDYLNQFRTDSSILVCTDLASRGLDVPNVDAVVQLMFAGNVVTHLHRMGRTGRAGNTGRGIVFYGQDQEELVRVVQQAEEQQENMVLQGPDIDFEEKDDEEEEEERGAVTKAFSRKRGFTKKRKKLRREEPEQ
jgi:superfamily II DNA/RNA helicase